MTITKIAPGYCDQCEKARPLWIIAGAKLCRGCIGSQARRRRALRLGTNGGSLRISASRPVVAEQSELAESAIIDSRAEREK